MATSTAATIRTVAPSAPSRARSCPVEPKVPAIGAPNSVADEALSNWVTDQPYKVFSCSGIVGLRWRNTCSRPRNTGICTTIGSRPMSGFAFSTR